MNVRHHPQIHSDFHNPESFHDCLAWCRGVLITAGVAVTGGKRQWEELSWERHPRQTGLPQKHQAELPEECQRLRDRGDGGGHPRLDVRLFHPGQGVSGAVQRGEALPPRASGAPAGAEHLLHLRPAAVGRHGGAAQTAAHPHLAASTRPLHQWRRDKSRDQPVHEYIRQQGGTLQWLLERCGYRFQVMTNQPTASQVQVHDLFEKIHWMIEAKKHLGELQCSIHSQRRPDLSRTEEQRRQTRPDMLEGSPGYWMEMQTRRPGRPAGEQPALSLVLLGRRRSGKSSAGNTVLGRDHFQTNRKTTRCSAGQGWVSGRPVTVVDTPGWSRFGLARPQQVKEEMSRSPSLCPAGSRLAFLLAVPVDSFSEKDRGAVEAYLSVLGEEVWRSSVVLLTFGEELRGRTLERYVEGQGRSLQWLLDRCGRRMCVFDSNVDEQTQVRQLLEVVEQLVK